MKIQKYKSKLVKDGVLTVRDSGILTSATIDTPIRASELIKSFIGKGADKESFVAVLLGASNGVLGISLISLGTLTAMLVHPREVFKAAVLAGAAGIIVGHNHPSGDVEPSREDRETTRRLVEAGKIIGIPVLDHVIVSDSKMFSFRERGMME